MNGKRKVSVEYRETLIHDLTSYELTHEKMKDRLEELECLVKYHERTSVRLTKACKNLEKQLCMLSKVIYECSGQCPYDAKGYCFAECDKHCDSKGECWQCWMAWSNDNAKEMEEDIQFEDMCKYWK